MLAMKKNKKLIALVISLSIYWNIIKEKVKPFLNIKFLLSFFCAWMVTNGWSYLFVVLGPVLNLKWMTTVGVSYQTFLWLPCTPEKIVTIPLAIFLHRIIFPRDFKNLEKLNRMFENAAKNNTIILFSNGFKNTNIIPAPNP